MVSKFICNQLPKPSSFTIDTESIFNKSQMIFNKHVNDFDNWKDVKAVDINKCYTHSLY